jgi:hypothetical protein
MNLNLTVKSKRVRHDAGIALITTILLLLLMSSLLIGFSVLLYTDIQLSGASNDQVRAFYGAEAGMEQMTANLGNLFSQNYSPSIAQINAISATPPVLQGIQYLKGDGSTGYSITPQAVDANGNPAPTISTIKSGSYQGMTAMATEYTLLVNARTVTGKEVTLRRTTQTVGIPMFQFGIFSDTDLSFFPGPVFNFGGRTHTNGNLFLATQATLTLSDKVDAYKDVIRTNLSNGFATAGVYTGTVNITTSPGSNNYRALGFGEGSLVGTLGSGADPNWGNISLGSTNYAGNLINGKGSAFPNASTGAKQLNLGIVTIGNGTTQEIDLVRRAKPGEAANVTAERYFAQASLMILLSDNPIDIMNLPCVDQNVQPFSLQDLAQPVANWTSASAVALRNKMNGEGANYIPLPLSASGAKVGTTNTSSYNPADGYWLPNGYPIIKGYIKIQAQTSYGSPCGTWQDVTQEILALGYVGRNINPLNPAGGLPAADYAPPNAGAGAPLYPLPVNGNSIPTSAQLGFQNGPGTCADPHPNAVIRLERVRDNPSTWNLSHCGQPATTNPPSDFWPNTLFDPREGTLRDAAPAAPFNAYPTLNGVMHYVELDGKNLAKWFGGLIGVSGPLTKDPVNSPNNFVVYISDRRGNYTPSQTWPGTWPPLSPSNNETGEYGWTDFVNPNNALTGCTDNALDSGEDLDGLALLFTYGANNSYIVDQGATPAPPAGAGNYGRYGIYSSGNKMFSAAANNTFALNGNPTCAAPGYSAASIWPMTYATSANAARENPPLFFRRAVKIVDAQDLTPVGGCPSGVSCGLTIATENPVYVQGDFNANSAGGGWNDPGIATSIAADAVTLLSDNWNDVNSFAGNNAAAIYGMSFRNGNTSWYRTAVVAGKGVSFPQPNGTSQDFGTDGGVHNFLRYIEAWGGTLNYRGSIVSMYYNRQATGVFKCCTTVYSPPTRGYNFDTSFLNPTLLPPRTPLFRDVNTTGFTRLLLPGQYQ